MLLKQAEALGSSWGCNDNGLLTVAGRAPGVREFRASTAGCSPGMGQSAFAPRLLFLTVSGWLLFGAFVEGQRSLPVSNSAQFAAALSNSVITEIILDPGGTGVSAFVLPKIYKNMHRLQWSVFV